MGLSSFAPPPASDRRSRVKRAASVLVAAVVVMMAFEAVGSLALPAALSNPASFGIHPGPTAPGATRFDPLGGSSNLSVYATIPLGGSPDGLAYDLATAQTFVSVNATSAFVAVISDSTFTSVATIHVGKMPETPTVDTGTGNVYVPNEGSANVSVVSPTNHTAFASVGVGSFPIGSVYDPTQHEVFVANSGSSTVSVIADSNNTVVKTINVGAVPTYLAFDTAKDEVFVTNVESGNVSVISAANNSVLASVKVKPTGSEPEGIAYDPAQAELFVADAGVDSVSVISDTNNSVVATIHVSESPWGVTYDTAGGTMYVSLETGYPSYGGNVSVLGAANRTVFATLPVGLNPELSSYDSARAMVFVGNTVSNTTSVIAETYPVTFTESGLPSGTTWNVSVPGGPTGSSDGTTISLDLPNGSYQFEPKSSNTKYEATNGSFSISGAGLEKSVTFSLVTYTVKFEETGLPGGKEWNVTLSGSRKNSTTSSLSYTEPNGSYTYSVATLPNNTESVYQPSPAEGDLNVSGASKTVTITFKLVPLYLVTFKETGLLPGLNWSVTSGGTTHNNTTAAVKNPLASTGTVTFLEANGSINFTFLAPHGYGVAKVSGVRKPTYSTGTVLGSTTVDVTFGALQSVTFSQKIVSTGLAPPAVGTWNVTLTPRSAAENPEVLTNSSTGTTIGFVLPKGAAYTFVITRPSDFIVTPVKGSLTVGAVALTKKVTFRPEEEKVLLEQTGLPRGTKWCVNVTGPMDGGACSSGASIALHLVNGTYTYTLTAAAGASFSQPSGNFSVAWAKGASLKVQVTGT
jgi:YVTN family beta-propeller protein